MSISNNVRNKRTTRPRGLANCGETKTTTLLLRKPPFRNRSDVRQLEPGQTVPLGVNKRFGAMKKGVRTWRGIERGKYQRHGPGCEEDEQRGECPEELGEVNYGKEEPEQEQWSCKKSRLVRWMI